MAFRGRPVTSATLMPNSVATIHIQNLAVTDAKIASLAVDKLTAGTLNAINVTVQAILSLNGTGLLRTSAPPGMRVEVTALLNDRISFFSGGADETTEGGIIVAYNPNYYGVGMGAPYVGFHAPDAADNPLGVGANTVLWLYPERAVINNPFQVPAGNAATPGLAYAGTAIGLFFDAVPTPLVGVTIAGTERAMISAALARFRSAAIQANDGAGTGDVEVFPYGTLIGGAYACSGVNQAMAGGGVSADILGPAGVAPVFACEYAGQLLIVDMTIMATASGITAGEWWTVEPYLNGALVPGGWIAQFMEEPAAAGAIGALAHAAGAAPGLGHSAGGTGNTGNHSCAYSGVTVGTTQHRHGPGTYAAGATPVTGNSAYESSHTHTIDHTHPAHNHSGPSHSDHGTHTIADHAAMAAHTHNRTYDGALTLRWVGNAAADVAGNLTLSIGGCTQVTAATLNQWGISYMIYRR